MTNQLQQIRALIESGASKEELLNAIDEMTEPSIKPLVADSPKFIIQTNYPYSHPNYRYSDVKEVSND